MTLITGTEHDGGESVVSQLLTRIRTSIDTASDPSRRVSILDPGTMCIINMHSENIPG